MYVICFFSRLINQIFFFFWCVAWDAFLRVCFIISILFYFLFSKGNSTYTFFETHLCPHTQSQIYTHIHIIYTAQSIYIYRVLGKSCIVRTIVWRKIKAEGRRKKYKHTRTHTHVIVFHTSTTNRTLNVWECVCYRSCHRSRSVVITRILLFIIYTIRSHAHTAVIQKQTSDVYYPASESLFFEYAHAQCFTKF